MKLKALIHGNIVQRDRIVEDGIIIFNHESIKYVGNSYDILTSNITQISARNKLVLPGLIDQHLHGAIGYDFMDTNSFNLDNICNYFAVNGTTSIVPTTIAATEEKLASSILNLANYINQSKTNGSKVLGINLEGPFINPKMRGAHIEKNIYGISQSYFEKLNNLSNDNIIITTIAPELKDASKLIKHIDSKNVIVSIGHSNATENVALTAFRNGAKCVTHGFNAMRAFHHRETGIIGALVHDSNIVVELIADNYMINNSTFEIALKLFGPDRIILISDSLSATGINNIREFDFSGQKLTIKNRVCYNDKRVWGSLSNLIDIVKNILKNTSATLSEAVNMCSINPAKLLNLSTQLGSLEIGKVADILVTEKDLKIITTYINGMPINNNYEIRT